MTLQRAVVNQLPEWFRSTSVGRSLVEAQEQAEHAERQAIVDRVAAERIELRSATEKHERVLLPLRSAALAAKTKYEIAEQKRLAAERERAKELSSLKNRIEADERALVMSADARIDAARRAMDARFERERHSLRRFEERPTGTFDGFSAAGKRVVRIVSNDRAVDQLVVAIREARHAFEILKLSNPADVDAAIAAIEATVERHWTAVAERRACIAAGCLARKGIEMAISRLFGRVHPYNVRTRSYVTTREYMQDMLYEETKFGALTCDALDDATLTEFRINHERTRTIEGASVGLIHGRSGLYMVARLPDCALTRSIMTIQSRWRGLSIGHVLSENEGFVDYQRNTLVLTRVGFVSEVSIVIDDKEPNYPGTWVIDATHGFSEAIARVKAAEHAANLAHFGSDYRAYQRYLWGLPRQGSRVEAGLCARNPDRAMDLTLMKMLGR